MKELLEKYIPYNEQEEKDKEVMLKYLNDFPNVYTRENEYGHFTASSWIVNKDRTKVLMIYHNIYDSWGWTGGHADGETNLYNVAVREANEETGITNLKPLTDGMFSIEILTVNGHVKRGKYVSSHVHLNVTYLFEADDTLSLHIKEDENSGVKWVDMDKAVSLSTEDNMKVVYQKIIDKLKGV